MNIVVMVVVIVLKGGMILQQAIHAPDHKECEITRPLIEGQVRREQKTLVKVTSVCLDFQGASFEGTTNATAKADS